MYHGLERFRPMLAADLSAQDAGLDAVKLPKLLSPKIDGFRALVLDGVLYSRNIKPVLNRYVQDILGRTTLNGLDGELVVGSATAPDCFTATSSGVRSADGEPDFTFHVFDHCGLAIGTQYEERHRAVRKLVAEFGRECKLVLVPQHEVTTRVKVRELESEYVAAGYEGVMLRDPRGVYKHGRSTPREDDLWKLKSFIDGVAVVTGVEEAQENTNEATLDELGRTKRSSAKAGRVGKGMVGAILVRDPKWGVMRLSPGVMTHSDRVMWWNMVAKPSVPDSLIGRRVIWRAFGYGVKDKPRFPRFYGVEE